MRYFEITMSGLPGEIAPMQSISVTEFTKRTRTASSGFVSRDLIRDMFQLRRVDESLSAMESNLRENIRQPSALQLNERICTSITTFRFRKAEAV